jgi:hypothetical protein
MSKRMAVLCGHLRRKHAQPYRPVAAQDGRNNSADSDSDSDFYYFYPHKVKDRATSVRGWLTGFVFLCNKIPILYFY